MHLVLCTLFVSLILQEHWTHGLAAPDKPVGESPLQMLVPGKEDSRATLNLNRQKRMADIRVYGSSLRWVEFQGSIPNGAVSYWNGYANRREYPCALSNCHIGFYTAGRGPYCSYPYADHESQASQFSLLVNPNERETLVWKGGSYGSIPNNAVNSCGGDRFYVGKNRYGLGKVDRRNTAFFIGIDGYEYWYKSYDVLTVA